MKKADVKITVYEMEDDFFVEVYQNDDIIEFWTYHQNYGIKEFMFGIPEKYFNEENSIENLIKGNFADCKKTYIKNYML